MNIYSACIRLNIWNVVKARAEVWAITKPCNNESLDELKLIAKKAFRTLCMEYHPDKGGSNQNFLDIQMAFDLIKDATYNNFINALNEEKQSKIIFMSPGSEKCGSCRKWSNLVSACITVTCSGFDEPTKDSRFVNIRRGQVFSDNGDESCRLVKR